MKPFDLEELILRIENITRRNRKVLTPSNIVILGTLEIDTEAQLVKKEGVRVDLSPKEYQILSVLLKYRGKIQTRDSLYEEIW